MRAFPRPGETVGGDSAYSRRAGGKGANQACAAARAGVEGVEVHFYGRVGRDDDFSVAELERAGVIAREVARDDALPTGSACVLCERASGENMIVVCAGANDAASARFGEGDESAVLALQGEVPVRANLDAVRTMRTVNPRCVVVLNYAPATEVSLELIEEVDCVVVNESEARAISEAYEILGEPAGASERPARNRAIVYTMGAAGARLVMTRDLRRCATRLSATATRPRPDTKRASKRCVSATTKPSSIPSVREMRLSVPSAPRWRATRRVRTRCV